MKVFISQPMNGLTDEQIRDTRYGAFEWIKQMYPDAEIVNDPIDREKYDELNPVVMLGTSIVLLGKADLAYFVKGWKDSRGCVIEHMVAEKYDIETIEED